MSVLHGGCRCGALVIAVTLPRPVADYAPRACDCSFCREHDAAWLSDPAGTLRMRQRGGDAVQRYRQGSGQADFLACAHCGELVLVACAIDGRLYAAVNAQTIAGVAPFAPAQPASPQRLSAEAKRERWQQLWFADVRIDADSGRVGR